MKEPTRTGGNLTGIQASPRFAKIMREGAETFTENIPSGDLGLMELRRQYILETGSVGSMPPPATVTALVKTAKKKIQGLRPEAFLDKLGERLAFERTGVRLYDALITKCEAIKSDLPADQLREFRAQELKHFEMIKNAIEGFGADPTAQTPCADMTGVQGMGMVQTLSDPRTSVSQSLQALLAVELIDNDGWELLIQLAQKMGLEDMTQKFELALSEEDNHLEHVRDWLKQLSLVELGVEKASELH